MVGTSNGSFMETPILPQNSNDKMVKTSNGAADIAPNEHNDQFDATKAKKRRRTSILTSSGEFVETKTKNNEKKEGETSVANGSYIEHVRDAPKKVLKTNRRRSVVVRASSGNFIETDQNKPN